MSTNRADHGDDEAAVELAAWVDAVADRFESAWRSLAPPRLADFLADATGPRRTALLGELVKLDLAYRRRLGERKTPEDYLTEFPELDGHEAFPAGPPAPPASTQTTAGSGQPTPAGHAGVVDVQPCVRGYEILGELGHGGMGVVYRARQESLNRLVALKMIRADSFAGPRERARFRTEAEAAARLQHPNIVRIYEVGEQAGRPFLALEYVEGGSLAQRLGGAPQPARGAAELVANLARAVQYAHEHGVVHRDLKPANILLSESGPRIADFGLAKQLGGDAAHQTQTGEVLGTPSYMAPEQAAGKPGTVGQPADVYGLGAILYELLTGRPPFRGETTLDTLEQVRTQEPVPPSRLQPRLPRDLGTVCLKALAKEPARRYATAGELADDLRRFLDGKPIRARPVGRGEALWRWCRRNPAVASLALAAGLFLMAGFAVSTYFAVEEGARAREAGEHAQTADRARKEALRESALLALERGRHLAQLGEGGRGLLWLARSLELATEAADPELPRVIRTNLTAVARRLHPLRQILPTRFPSARCVLTPDGRKVWVSSWGGNQVRLWDVATAQPGPALPLDQAEASAVALSPDGTLLFVGGVTQAGGVTQSRFWDTATNRPRGPPLRHPTTARCAAFHPEGRVLATGHHGGRAYLWDVATGQLRAELRGHRAEVLGVAFSPDGKTLATGSIDDVLLLWDTATARPVGKPILHRGQVSALAWDPGGRAILTGDAYGRVRSWQLATAQPDRSLDHPSSIHALGFSRDGRILATACGDRAARLWNAEGHLVGNLLPHQSAVRSAALSPDGKVLATAGDDGVARIWELAAGPVELPHRSWVHAADFSADSRTLLTACGDGTVQRWEVATGKRLGPPLEHKDEVRAVRFRSDGNALLAGCMNGQVWLWSLPAAKSLGKFDPHREAITCLAVSPDGRVLATGSTDWSARLFQRDAKTGQPRSDPLRHEGAVTGAAFSPDSRTVLTGSADKTARLWDASTGRPRGAPLAHPDEVVAVAFRRDGLRFFTASRDTGVRVWDSATREPVGKPLMLERALTCMALSPDGQTLLLGSHDGMAQLFDLATGLPLGTPFSQGRAVLTVSFSPDGRVALTAGQHHLARLWQVPAPPRGRSGTHPLVGPGDHRPGAESRRHGVGAGSADLAAAAPTSPSPGGRAACSAVACCTGFPNISCPTGRFFSSFRDKYVDARVRARAVASSPQRGITRWILSPVTAGPRANVSSATRTGCLAAHRPWNCWRTVVFPR